MGRRMMRGMAGVGAALLALMLTTACVPEPAPSPTPTGFASEEEAFAAAEATYRAYVDAVNARRENPDSSPDPTDFLTGDALSAEIASEARFAEAGVVLEGAMQVSSIHGISATEAAADVAVCLDVSSTRVVDVTGADVTPADRQDVLGLTITVLWSVDRPYISSTTASDGQC